MKQKKWYCRALSEILAMVMLFTTVLTPLPAFAAEDGLAAYVNALPTMEEVAGRLDQEELISWEDYSVEAGSEIDLKTDFANITFNGEKVKISFFEAKNGEGQDFSATHADNYRATYYAEPYSGNPAYRFNRMISVTDPVIVEEEATDNLAKVMEEPDKDKSDVEDTDADLSIEASEPAIKPDDVPLTDEESGDDEGFSVSAPNNAEDNEEIEGVVPSEDTDSAEVSSVSPEEGSLEISDLEGYELSDGEERPVEYFGETWTTLTGVLAWASDEDRRDLLGEPDASMLRGVTGSQSVTITKGEDYFYADYGFGDYVTSQHYVKFANISAVAVCVQPALPAPENGVYTIASVGGNTALAKVLYYADEFFNNKHPDFSTGKRFIIKHLAASYANGSDDAFIMTSELAQSLAREMYNYCNSKANLPSVAMSLSDTSLKA